MQERVWSGAAMNVPLSQPALQVFDPVAEGLSCRVLDVST